MSIVAPPKKIEASAYIFILQVGAPYNAALFVPVCDIVLVKLLCATPACYTSASVDSAGVRYTAVFFSFQVQALQGDHQSVAIIVPAERVTASLEHCSGLDW